MNIAVFASQFYPHTGGVEELVRQLAHEQVRRGNRVVIFTNRWPKSLANVEEYEKLEVHRYVFRFPGPNLRQMLSFLLYKSNTLGRVCSDLRAYKIDLIHIQCVGPNAYYALMAKRCLKIPLVVTLHGELTMDATGFYERSAFGRKLLPMVLKEADAITACSHHTLDRAEEFFGSHFDKRGRIICNGIQLEEFLSATPYTYTRPYVFAVGRFIPQKGFDVLLRAFAMMVRSGNETHDLLLAGDGVERGNLERLSAELGISSHVRFLGITTHSETIRLFTGCSFFVLPSRIEPLGIVNLEAMAAGKAVVASRVGGVPEVVLPGQTGLLVPPEDASALSEAIVKLMVDVKLRERLGEAGRKRIQCFSWPIIAEQYERAYAEAAARHRN
jgi:glycosyltransferase involved in cell wall biosynthesis